MKIARPFQFLGELILVEVRLRGPRSESVRNLVLDTGAAATTLLPEVIDDLGYSARDGSQRSRVHGAIGEEHGYSLNVAEFSALGVTTPNFLVNVFDLGHDGFDGLIGMNFLRHFNFEVRPLDRLIVVELISGQWSHVVDDEPPA
jgi:predicted aspartyl protease